MIGNLHQPLRMGFGMGDVSRTDNIIKIWLEAMFRKHALHGVGAVGGDGGPVPSAQFFKKSGSGGAPWSCL